jgi:clan AA aspartic protease
LSTSFRSACADPTAWSLRFDAIIDTGFTGSLTLPLASAQQMALIQCAVGTARLADGTSCSFPIYSIDLEWHGTFRNVLVSAMGTECLLGMQFLDGYELRIDVRAGGTVELTKLP